MSEAEERHASWLELFFDLVVVVAVAQLAQRLRHPTWAGVALFVLMYYAVWSIWTTLTLYSNVRAERTRTRSMLIGMFCIAVMAAAIPDVARDGGLHEGWFIAAYIICRIGASQTLQQSGTIMTAWPAAQLGAGLLPWLVSIWADQPLRYLLWGLGLALDMAFSVLRSRDPQRLIAVMERQARRFYARARRWEGADRQASPAPKVAAAVLDPAHLSERLGLFVIIVLGEAVAQVILSSSGMAWDWRFALAALAAFGLIVALWWLTVRFGINTVVGPSDRPMKAYVALPAHFAMTAGLTATAAGLGVAVTQPAAPLQGGIEWVLGGGLACYFAASTVLGAAARAERRWLWSWGIPCVVAPLVVAAVAGVVPGWVVVASSLGVALWRVAYRPREGL
ncbi:low temperature requirement protein A [Nonomuraea gerenzanensis]|uniref:Low temperature requirement protein A n=1 Tax=Nonomuraea gerenzanensis TaxID=93944 RepID=A0A1M4EPS9_9ACTN|nr:low temperature requirement protein A [Nonomuraea gerenzanensis]UBU12289.1 low temperature requirement protein A [Nonomuraea gerenzanensis]SBP00827.1 Low temperature requirement protein A [Nonomuraea gerenzanensis]